MTIQARYSGVCPECEERWQPGDLIRADDDRQWKHVVCPDAPPEREHPVCQTCWLTHPEAEGVCDR